jgi:hypothetical protein
LSTSNVKLWKNGHEIEIFLKNSEKSGESFRAEKHSVGSQTKAKK